MESTRIRLVSGDGQVFEVKRIAVSRSSTIMEALRLRVKSNDDSPLVLNGIDGETLEKVIEYCDRHYVPFSDLADEAVFNSLKAFDADFVNVDETTFFNLIDAAAYLKIKSLMDLTCATLSKKFKGKNYKEIGEVIENWKQYAD
ncbi:SKP1-like protein 20 [Apium graveolens]|uniref:SKP1-like protein 20 n=1 Tax=Apium graveolens TaxID=4045 RepID=UPI003D792C6A